MGGKNEKSEMFASETNYPNIITETNAKQTLQY